MAKKPKNAAPADQPYYLQRAHIKDFRSIRDAVVEFKPGLNIIIGPNGSGKTNFAISVAEALSFSTPIIEYIQQGEFSISGRKDIKLVCSREDTSNSEPINKSRFASFFIEHTMNIELTTEGNKSMGNSLAEAVANNQNLVQEYILFQPILIKYGTPDYYSIANTLVVEPNSRDWQSENGFPETVSRILINNIASSEAAFKKFNADSLLLLIREIINFYINDLKYYIEKYSPIRDIRLSSSIQINKNSIQEEIKIRGIKLEFRINDDWILFEDLSSGTQRIVYILFEVIRPADYSLANRNTSDYASTDDRIIFLEEPELGIHPDQLNLLLAFLREQSKRHQLIITTHSPQVLDMLNDDELDRITICELHKTKGTQFRKLRKTQIAAAKQYMSTQGLYLSDYWRYGSLESTK